MNIFCLDQDPASAAAMHCDKHVVKMIVEYAQLLSTAHRVLDGDKQTQVINGRSRQVFVLSGEQQELVCYKATHINHPCAIWARSSSANYNWLVQLLSCVLAQYTDRYGKQHATTKFLPFLSKLPNNIPHGELTAFAQAMPDEYRSADAVLAYRTYYIHAKSSFAKWRMGNVPEWFTSQQA